MKRITLMLALFAFGFLVLGTTDASARWHRHGPKGGDAAGIGAGFIRSLDRMDLSVDQKRQVASVLKSHREEIAQEMTSAAEARAALRKAMQAPVYSDEDVKAAARTMATQHERMILLKATIMNEVRSILTPDQNERIQEFAGRRMGRFQGTVDSRLSAMDRWIAEHSE